MVNLSKDDELIIKIVLWGATASGKTEFLEELYDICKLNNKELISSGEFKKIEQSNGATLYFDRLILLSKEIPRFIFHYYSGPGPKRFFPLRKKVATGMDGVIFIVDSQRSRLQDNIDSYKELSRFLKNNFNQKIPLAIILNKSDLDDIITQNEWLDCLVEEVIHLEDYNSPFAMNSLIYTTHLYENNNTPIFNRNYEMFYQISRRILAYTIHRPKNISDEHSFVYETFYEKESGFKLTDSTVLDHLVKSLKNEREERETEENLRKKEEEIKESLRKNEEEIKEKQKKKAMLQKIKQILSVSTKIRLEMMRKALGLDENNFIERIFDWASQFGFKIDGDFIIVEDADIEGFIAQLDQQFKNWNDIKKTQKVD